jgi:triosephosphate isomerase
MIILNLKTYEESVGDKGLRLAKIAQEVAQETKRDIIVAPQTQDLKWLAPQVAVPVYAQHVDPFQCGAFTGSVSLVGIKAAGCRGTLVNHSERKLRLIDIQQVIEKARELGLATVACANNVPEGEAVAALGPTMVAVEPPELIGSGISVSTAKPEVVSDAVRKIKAVNPKVRVLCGAGVSNAVDVAKAFELGAEGVLLASAFVKAKDPKALLREMAEAVPPKK